MSLAVRLAVAVVTLTVTAVSATGCCCCSPPTPFALPNEIARARQELPPPGIAADQGTVAAAR
jgi:hypothetical protein